MVEFQRTIGRSEENTCYLNLTDINGRSYGSRFPEHKTPLWIITEGKRYEASKHGGNQIWGNLRSWYKGEEIHAGDTIHIKYDPLADNIDGRVPVEISVAKRTENIPGIIVQKEPEEIEDAGAKVDIQMERDLENFLVNNLNLIEERLKLYEEEGINGRQYPTDVGTIDLLCKKAENFVVVELKKGRGSDSVVGQISRYIGWVRENLSNGHDVRGIIIVHDFDPKLKYAVLAHENLELKYYEIQIKFVSKQQIIEKFEKNI